MSRIGLSLLSFLCLLNTSCSVNILAPFADEETDRALLEEAKIEINKGSYSSAISLFSQMSSDFLSEDDVVPYYASAYAGVCGLDFLTFSTALEGLSGSTLFELLLSTYTGGDTTAKSDRITNCDTAISIIEAKWPTDAERGDDNNLLYSFILLAKMGNTFALTADEDATNGNDGAVDSDFDACDTADISDEQIEDYGGALIKAVNALSTVSSVSVGDSSVSTVNSICSAVSAIDADVCTKTSGYDASELLALRVILYEGEDIGIDSCTVTEALNPPSISNGCDCI